MLIKASLNNIRIAPRKVRLVADLIRGASFGEAERQLMFSDKKSALPVLKLLRSAKANAKINFNVQDASLLHIKEIRVDEGPHSLKRFFPRAMGRAYPIMKRISHINLILETKDFKINKNKINEAETDVVSNIKREKTDIDNKHSGVGYVPGKSYGSSDEVKKKFSSKQLKSFGKKFFRRKSV